MTQAAPSGGAAPAQGDRGGTQGALASRLGAATASPLVQFFAGGAVIFGLYTLGPAGAPEPADTIIVTLAEQQNLAALFEKTWRRPPTAAERESLIAARLEEELLYREALALGLETDDVVIRRRLAQKVEFILDDFSARRDPTEADLAAFLDANADRYATEATITFRQIFFSSERRGERLHEDARLVLAALASGTDPATLGDAAPLPEVMEAAPVSRIARVFGEDFASSIDAAGTGGWAGPVPSAFGVHLVLILDRQAGRTPSLAEALEDVERDWREAERQKARAAYLDRLRARYDIRVEGAGAVRE